jgi:hypothetical protein
MGRAGQILQQLELRKLSTSSDLNPHAPESWQLSKPTAATKATEGYLFY